MTQLEIKFQFLEKPPWWEVRDILDLIVKRSFSFLTPKWWSTRFVPVKIPTQNREICIKIEIKYVGQLSFEGAKMEVGLKTSSRFGSFMSLLNTDIPKLKYGESIELKTPWRAIPFQEMCSINGEIRNSSGGFDMLVSGPYELANERTTFANPCFIRSSESVGRFWGGILNSSIAIIAIIISMMALKSSSKWESSQTIQLNTLTAEIKESVKNIRSAITEQSRTNALIANQLRSSLDEIESSLRSISATLSKNLKELSKRRE